MATEASGTRGRTAAICCLVAVVLAVVAWFVPARWRSTHPLVLEAAGRGTAQVLEVAVLAARQQRLGLANLLLEAAVKAKMPGTNEVVTSFAAGGLPSPEVRALGGPDAPVAALLPGLAEPGATPPRTALDLFLPTDHRATVRRQMAESRSPGVQKLLKILELPTRRFVPVNQAGGQPLEAISLLTATLYERERFSPTLAQELRDLADQATAQEKSRDRLEEALLGLLSISRLLDWTSLSELARKTPDVAALGQFATAARLRPDDFALLYSASLLSGDINGTARYLLEQGDVGRAGLIQGLRAGAGALRLLAKSGFPVRPGLACPAFVAQAVYQAPQEFAYARTGVFFTAALLFAVGVTLFGMGQTAGSGVAPGTNWLPGLILAALIGGLLAIASEPLPESRSTVTKYPWRLETGALTKSSSVANPSENKKQIMGPSTLLTIGIFAAFQVAVYVVCLRKLSELSRLPDPPLVRLRLLENEENLFDVGLYVGIGGTATALVLQVLQLVEANLLAAYSSNLMGIICVALVKIGHVRSAKRRLILQSQDIAVAPAIAAENPAPPTTDPTAANPFAKR